MLQRNFLSVPKSGYVLLRKEESGDVITFQGIPVCSIFSNAAETEEHLQRKVTRCNSGEYHSCRLAELVNFSNCIGKTKTEGVWVQSLFHFYAVFYCHLQGNVFRSVCHSVNRGMCRGRGHVWQRGEIHGRGRDIKSSGGSRISQTAVPTIGFVANLSFDKILPKIAWTFLKSRTEWMVYAFLAPPLDPPMVIEPRGVVGTSIPSVPHWILINLIPY